MPEFLGLFADYKANFGKKLSAARPLSPDGGLNIREKKRTCLREMNKKGD